VCTIRNINLRYISSGLLKCIVIIRLYVVIYTKTFDYIEEAAKRREKIKAVSTKYSEMWTDISDSDGIVIDTSRYDML
jgi:hypothetical protein